MEDGFPLFDPNNEAERQAQKLKDYYESFSANARLRLLSKTVVRPSSVYDVLYPQVRVEQISKNIPLFTDLEENAKLIRDRLVSKIVAEESDLEKISEDFRKSLLARAKIHDDKNELLSSSKYFRESNTSRNNLSESDLESDSSSFRTNNISKNKVNPSLDKDKDSETFKEINISKNTSKDQDLLRDSLSFRKNNISKNSENVDIDKMSEAFRNNNLAKNISDIENSSRGIEGNSVSYRNRQLSKNVGKKLDIDKESSVFREVNKSKNSTKGHDLERDSVDFRKNSEKLNNTKKSDIEIDSISFRKDNLGKNKPRSFDQFEDSVPFRSNNLSLNISKDIDLEKLSSDFRSKVISRNEHKDSELESNSSLYRDVNTFKNSPNKSNLETDSESFRDSELSRNKPKESDLEKDSEPIRKNVESLNKLSDTNLEEISKSFRNDGVSKNKQSDLDLESYSTDFRNNNESLNSSNDTNLEIDSLGFRDKNTSLNKGSYSDLEVDSTPFRGRNLSLNSLKNTDLEVDSVGFRSNVLSFNSFSTTDLEIDSIPFRDVNMSNNSLTTSDLETYSTSFRDDNLSYNIPSSSDLEVDSVPFRNNVLSSNVPSISDLDSDSIPFRDSNVSGNMFNGGDLETDSVPFRDNNISGNVPNSSDLESDSSVFRENLISANAGSSSDLEADSAQIRDDLLSSNTLAGGDLMTDSESYRKQAMAKNDIFGLLGVNVHGAGTSSFLGISRVFVQGALIRKMLLSKNKPKRMDLEGDTHVFRENNIQKNKWRVSENEYTSTSLNWNLGKINQGSYKTDLVDFSTLIKYENPVANSILSTDEYIKNEGKALQDFYGTSSSDDFQGGIKNRKISDALYYVDTISPRGGGFEGSTLSKNTWVPYSEGVLTSAIRRYNQEKNAFNLSGLQPGNPATLSELQGYTQDGFQDLIKSTIGFFNGGGQARTLTTPANVIQKNGGAYHKGDSGNSDISRPGGEDAELGSAKSMMAKTIPGNAYDDEDFFTGKRGVKHVINTIKNSGERLASNYDPQYSKAYLIGTNRDGTPKVARQKYTIANPHAPGKAGKLLFSIKNYSSGDQFFFPPYIQSIQNTESASWNSVNFLGRPETMYTYNNSNRDATITFFVLTDYAEKVDIGRDWSKDDAPKVTSTFNKHFTDGDVAQNNQRKLEQEKLRKLQSELGVELKGINEKKLVNGIEQSTSDTADKDVNYEIEYSTNKPLGVFKGLKEQKIEAEQIEKNASFQASSNSVEQSGYDDEIDRLLKNRADLNKSIGEALEDLNTPTNYSESNNTAGNIYGFNIDKKEYNGQEIISKPEDTIVRLDPMKKGLMFQPAFFSGDKVDFVRRVEFLSKLTRPSANLEQSESGFSFTKPPICHIRLGDWWNHDIVVNSVSYDYTDAPWTLDGGRVQPMWVSVTIGFNIIGPYGVETGRPPLSTDNGGMYSPTKRQ